MKKLLSVLCSFALSLFCLSSSLTIAYTPSKVEYQTSPSQLKHQSSSAKYSTHLKTFCNVLSVVVFCSLGSLLAFYRGQTEGHLSGYQEGYDKGQTEGHLSGYQEGYDKGKTEGHLSGYQEGYDKGEKEGRTTGNLRQLFAWYESGYRIGSLERNDPAIPLTKRWIRQTMAPLNPYYLENNPEECFKITEYIFTTFAGVLENESLAFFA